MESVTLAPLDDIGIDPWIAALPKADLHIHQEQSPHLDRVLARGQGRPPYDWRGWAERQVQMRYPQLKELDDWNLL